MSKTLDSICFLLSESLFSNIVVSADREVVFVLVFRFRLSVGHAGSGTMLGVQPCKNTII